MERLTPKGCIHCDHYCIILMGEYCVSEQVCEKIVKAQTPVHGGSDLNAVPVELAVPFCNGKYLER